MDALVRQGLRFTRAHPEAMPTVPARNSILSGRRQFPFRGWHDWRGLLDSPGWSPLRDVESSLPAVLRRAGYWTASATDNPFLSFSYPYRPLRRSFNRFVRTGGQIGGRRTGVSDREMRHWLFPALEHDAKARLRLRKYIANSHNAHDESRSFAARVFKDGMRLLDQAAAQRPFALFLDTYEPHEPWTPAAQVRGALRRSRLPRARAGHAPVRADLGLHARRGPLAAPEAHARALLGRADHDRRLARALPRPLPPARPGPRHRDRAGGRSRLPARRLRMDREDLLDPPPRRSYACRWWWCTRPGGGRGGPATTWPRPTTSRPRCSPSPACGRRGGWTASTCRRSSRAGARTGGRWPTAGYANSLYARTERWKLISDNRGRNRRLYDLKHDPNETRNLARRHPRRAAAMYDAVARRAGGRPPYYENSRP